MLSINITEQGETDDGWSFLVEVDEGDGISEHEVQVTREYYERIIPDTEMKPDELVRESFEFLLDREPQEAILTSFDLSEIAHHFPEYEDIIAHQV